MHDLKDKVVLITGAASGVGAGVVRQLMEEGVQHVAILDIAKDAGQAFQDELNAKYGDNKVKFHLCDVTNQEEFLRIMRDVKSQQGYLDLVINNAGIMNDSWEIYQKEILINVTAVVTGTLRGMEMMSKAEGGRGGTIINLSSSSALCQVPLMPVYWATKSAVLQFSNCLGMKYYYNKSGVRVIAMCLGPTASGLLSMQKLGSFDKDFEAVYTEVEKKNKYQEIESAAKGIIEAYKRGESGSTWLAARGETAKDITGDVQKAYGILSAHAMNSTQ